MEPVFTKHSDTEVKVTQTVEQVVSVEQMKRDKFLVEEQINQLKKKLDTINKQLEKAKEVGVE